MFRVHFKVGNTVTRRGERGAAEARHAKKRSRTRDPIHPV
jgi:hypothetical protein